jgi:hypothetical protein
MQAGLKSGLRDEFIFIGEFKLHGDLLQVLLILLSKLSVLIIEKSDIPPCPAVGVTYLLCLQLVLQHGLALMQPTESVDFLLILAANLIFLAASHPLLIFGELDTCQC